MAVVRYHADGTLDTGFGDERHVTADFHGKGEFGQDVAIQPDGKIVAAGYTANGIDTEFALIRINPVAGALNSSNGLEPPTPPLTGNVRRGSPRVVYSDNSRNGAARGGYGPSLRESQVLSPTQAAKIARAMTTRTQKRSPTSATSKKTTSTAERIAHPARNRTTSVARRLTSASLPHTARTGQRKTVRAKPSADSEPVEQHGHAGREIRVPEPSHQVPGHRRGVHDEGDTVLAGMTSRPSEPTRYSFSRYAL